MPWEQTQISVSSGLLFAGTLEPGRHPRSSAAHLVNRQPCKADTATCHPVRETMVNEAKQGPGGLRRCCFYFLSIRLTFSFLHPSLFVHLLCRFLLLFYYSLASAFPFSASTSSCHKEPESSPERSLPALRCNPIIWQKSVSSPQSNRKSCEPDRSPRLRLPLSPVHTHAPEKTDTLFFSLTLETYIFMVMSSQTKHQWYFIIFFTLKKEVASWDHTRIHGDVGTYYQS